jgi:predicted phage terminase large subunit-like protein
MKTLTRPAELEETDLDEDFLQESFSEDELLRELCKSSLFDFVQEFWSEIVDEEPVWNWHIKFLCDEFQKIAERVFRGEPLEADTTVNISPGTTKTTIISVMLPAWIWTRMPKARIASVSYAHDQAMLASQLSRDLITSDKYKRLFPEIELRDDTNAKAHYANGLKGYRFACGVDGQILGKHFHFIIVDDPINPEQAASDAELKRVNRFMERTLPSRKVDKKITPIILIMQRLHENDPAGARLEKARTGMPHHWICLPAELTEDVNPPECRGCYVDGLMDPVRLDAATLERIEQEQGDYVYAGQYLQRPIPEGTAMFHVGKLNVVKRLPEGVKIVRKIRSWDKACSTNEGAAWTVGFLMGVDNDGHYWFLDVFRARLDSWARERTIRSTAKDDGRYTEIAVEQEPGSGGKHSAEYTARNLAGHKVHVVGVGKSDGDKVARAYAMSTQVNAGNVSVLAAPWNVTLINEMRFFPNSTYKDQVDAASLAFNILSNKKRVLGGRGTFQRIARAGK